MLDSKGTGELPLLRELSALQKARSLRDPTTTSARSSQSARGSTGRRGPKDRATRRDGTSGVELRKGTRKGRATPTDSPNVDHRADEQSGVEWSGELGTGQDLRNGTNEAGEAEQANGYHHRPPRPRPDRKSRNSSAREGKQTENWDTQSWLQDSGGTAEQDREGERIVRRDRGRGGRDIARDRRKEDEHGRHVRAEEAGLDAERTRDCRQEFSTPPRRSVSVASSHRNDDSWREEVAKKKDHLLREYARRAYEQHSATNGSSRGLENLLNEDEFSDASEEAELSTDMIELDALTPLQSQSQSPLLLRDGLRDRSARSTGRRRRSRALLVSQRHPEDGLSLQADFNSEDVRRGRRSLHPVGSLAGIDDLDVSSQFPTNGCGMPWYWSKIHKYKGKNILDLAGSLACGSISESSRRYSAKGASRRRSSGSYDSDQFELDTDTEALLRSGDHSRQPAGSLDLDGDEEARNYLKNLGYGAAGKSFLQLGSLFWSEQLGAGESKHRSLSQKYRPKSFKELVGQNLVVKALSNAVMQGKIAPVYLFQGPRGTGKTSTARIFAGVLNCLADSLPARPCGICRECMALASRRTLDVTEVQVATNNGMDTMRELMATVLLPPTSSRFRIFIIDECHMLTKEAWNGFLKCLEEPPERVVFLLITTDPEQLPRTAASRCQKFSFFNIKESEIISRLRTLSTKENLQVDDQALGLIAAQADGSLRDAETMLDQLSLLGKEISLPMVQELVGLVADTKLVNLLDMALSADTVSTVKCIRELLEAGAEPLALVNQLATLITNILAGSYKITEGQRMTGFFEKHNLQEESESLRQALKVLSEAEKQLRVSNDRTTWLTAALLQFAPDRSLLFPTSSAATSVAESPGARVESSEKDTVEINSSAVVQGWDKQATIENQRFHAEPAPSSTMPTELRRSVSKGEGNASARFTEAKVYSADSSPLNPEQVKQAELKAPLADTNPEAEAPRVSTSGNLNSVPELGLKDFTTLSHRKLDDIWNRVLEGIRSLVLKELLQVQSRLLSLSLSDNGYAVAIIEFRHPDHKSKALRSRSTIAHAFHMAVGCPVEVKLSLACMPEEGEDGNPRRRELHSGPNLSEQQTAAPTVGAQPHHGETPLDKRSGLSGIRRPQVDSTYRRTQQAFPNLEAEKVPSVSSSWTGGAVPSTDTSTPRYIAQGSEISHFQDEDHLENLWTRDHRYHQPLVHATRSPEQLWSLKDGQELKKETVFSTGAKKISLGTVMSQAQGFEPDNEYVTRLSKRKVAKHFGANGNGAIRAIEQENMRLESRVSNSSLLCWKPSPPDDEVKSNVSRKQKKVDFFLRLVPCAKKSE